MAKEETKNSQEVITEQDWVVVARPGYLGSRRDQMHAFWNQLYGEGNWRISHRDAQGKKLSFQACFEVYVDGYSEYFRNYPEEAKFLAENFSYAYDETLVSKEEAFDPFALYHKPGFSTQFHHVALNIALERHLGWIFKGSKPIQVRGGKPGTPTKTWPEGWRWHPGLIPCTKPELIPKGLNFERKWWQDNSIEDFYQSTKVLEVKGSIKQNEQTLR